MPYCLCLALRRYTHHDCARVRPVGIVLEYGIAAAWVIQTKQVVSEIPFNRVLEKKVLSIKPADQNAEISHSKFIIELVRIPKLSPTG